MNAIYTCSIENTRNYISFAKIDWLQFHPKRLPISFKWNCVMVIIECIWIVFCLSALWQTGHCPGCMSPKAHSYWDGFQSLMKEKMVKLKLQVRLKISLWHVWPPGIISSPSNTSLRTAACTVYSLTHGRSDLGQVQVVQNSVVSAPFRDCKYNMSPFIRAAEGESRHFKT